MASEVESALTRVELLVDASAEPRSTTACSVRVFASTRPLVISEPTTRPKVSTSAPDAASVMVTTRTCSDRRQVCRALARREAGRGGRSIGAAAQAVPAL